MHSFKKCIDGTIKVDTIGETVSWVLKDLYNNGFLTIKPLGVIAGEKQITDIDNITHTVVTVGTFLDKAEKKE